MTTENVITNLIPDLFAALDVVSDLKRGFLNAVSRDSGVERAALNQTVRSFATREATVDDITPGQLPDDDGNQTIDNKTITISKSRSARIVWNGEQVAGLNHGPGHNLIFQDQMKQGMIKILDEAEADLAAQYVNASRSVSPDDTSLYNSGVHDSANIFKVLCDNGAPQDDLHQIIDTTAGAALRSLEQLTKANEAASDVLLRDGLLGQLHRMKIAESGQIATHTAGDAASSTTDAAGYAIGDTTITLASAGTGAILSGDVVSFAGDSNKYVVLTGDSDVSDGGTIVLNAPGLRQAISGATAITVQTDYTPNLAFAKNAIHLATRLPFQPPLGDSASDSMVITDPKSNLSFDVRAYKQYNQVKWEIGLAWGFATIKPEHLAILSSV